MWLFDFFCHPCFCWLTPFRGSHASDLINSKHLCHKGGNAVNGRLRFRCACYTSLHVKRNLIKYISDIQVETIDF